MRSFGILVGLIAGCHAFCAGAAFAEKRVALVIGNSAYQYAPRLLNPEKDAAAIGLLLKRIGFDTVEVRENLTVNELRRAVSNFTDVSSEADISVIYFAGHGIEVDGNNYLIPVDAAMRRDVDVEDETVSLDRLLRVMQPARKLRLVILDACRDNPFAKDIKRTLASRSIGRGLARVEVTASDTLVAFAAKAGSTARDGDGPNSPFTSALLRHLGTPDLDLRIAFGRVRDDVVKNTENKQEPFVYGSLGGSIVTLASLTLGDRVDAASADSDSAIVRDYEAAGKVATKEAWDAFLAAHPKGFYADLARTQRAKVAPPAGTPKVANLGPAAVDNVDRKEKKDRKADKPKPDYRSAQERCLAGVLRRQGGSFMPEGQSTSCMAPNSYLTCRKSRSDAVAMCRTGVFGG